MHATAPDEPLSFQWRRIRGGETLTATLRFVMRIVKTNEPLLFAPARSRDLGTLPPYAGARRYRNGRAIAFDLVPLAPPPRMTSTAFRPSHIGDEIFHDVAHLAFTGLADVEVFHPIVIADGPLFAIGENGGLNTTDLVRIERQPIAGSGRIWSDVVTQSALDATIESHLRWYSRFYKRRNAVRV